VEDERESKRKKNKKELPDDADLVSTGDGLFLLSVRQERTELP
jgi:hypothetical protein